MIFCEKIKISVVIIISTLMVSSCNQSTEEANTDIQSNVLTEVTNVKTGPFVAMSNNKVTIKENEYFTLNVTANDFTSSEGGAITIRFIQNCYRCLELL